VAMVVNYDCDMFFIQATGGPINSHLKLQIVASRVISYNQKHVYWPKFMVVNCDWNCL
jgi:hypothetical protein